MFQTIQEGLSVYKKAVKDYLLKSQEVERRERKSHRSQRTNYHGFIDWPQEDKDWWGDTRQQLEGMATALGLSLEEGIDIWRTAREEIGKTKN